MDQDTELRLAAAHSTSNAANEGSGPPASFDLATFFEGVYLFQNWEILPGVKTGGPKDISLSLEKLKFPRDLSGKRVLDIAPWNGFFSFECARRGAAEVVSLGPEDPAATGYQRTREFLGFRNCIYRRGSVYDLLPSVHGTFDVVLCLGLLYHLRHPLLVLDKIYDVCTDLLCIDTPIIDYHVFDRTVSPEVSNSMIAAGLVMHHLPMVYFSKSNETGDAFNWFMPNRRALNDFVESSGFEVTTFAEDESRRWAWLAAKKGERQFTVDLEGYNPRAAVTG